MIADPSPSAVTETLNRFVQKDASDGLILVPQITPAGLDPFVDRVVPLLQERGVFRADYATTTLRDHLASVAVAEADRVAS